MTRPLTPSDCNLRDFAFMPLEVDRLRRSKSWLIAKREPALAFYLINLWCASWHEVPAASLENDDDVLADMAMCDPKRWPTVKETVMRNWVLCDDDRWYHPIVAEKAIESWRSKLEHGYKRLTERLRKTNKIRESQKLPSIPVPALEEWLSAGRAEPLPPEFQRKDDGIPAENALKGSKGRSKGEVREGTGTGIVEPKGSKALVPVAKTRPAPGEGRTSETWTAYKDAYREVHGVEPPRNKTVNAHLASFIERVGAEAAPGVAAHYCKSKRGLYMSAKHPTNLLLRDAEALHTEWATGTHGTDTQARQADQTQTRGSVFGALIEEAKRGAKNGTDG